MADRNQTAGLQHWQAMVATSDQRNRVETRRVDGRRGVVLTLADQLVSSGSNFALGVLVARAGGAGALGAFGIAFLVWLAVLGVNRALVSQPMTVSGPSDCGADTSEGCLASLTLSLAVATTLAAVAGIFLLAGFKPAVALLSLAPWIPSLLLQDYYRLMSFRQQRPDHALISDILFTCTQAVVTAALLVLHITNVSAFLAAWGLGATVGAWKLIGPSVLRTPLRRGTTHFQRLWPQSRWFLAEFTTAFGAVQGYLLLLPLLLGTMAFGQYRAGWSLIGPVVVIFIAGENVGLPGCVRQFRQEGIAGLDKYVGQLTTALVLLTTVYCGAVSVFAAPILQLVYGEPFIGAAVITQFTALDYAISALGFGCNQALKATHQMKRLWTIRIPCAIISVTTTIVLVKRFGLIGAGWASVVGAFAYTMGVILCYLRTRTLPLSESSG